MDCEPSCSSVLTTESGRGTSKTRKFPYWEHVTGAKSQKLEETAGAGKLCYKSTINDENETEDFVRRFQ
jgi:hypothetical protein